MRLNAFLAKTGILSRRKADELIKTGRVVVNGRPGQLNDDVTDGDRVELDGRHIEPQANRYILLNKPTGYVTTLSDPVGRPKVTDLINVGERIAPVGRLDVYTSGLLILTNDGDLAHKLMHPSFKVEKTYEVEFKGEITPEILNKLSNGIRLEDGMTAPAKTSKNSANKVELTIREGRKRQVRRMMAAVGLPVISLNRSKYGPLSLDGLKPGQWRELTDTEVKSLKA